MEKILKNKTILTIILLILVVGAIFLYLSIFRTCTVTFTLKIGAGIKSQEVKINDVVKEPEIPTADGYKFIGWYLNDELYDFNTPVKKNINLEAKWEKVDDK